MSEREEKRLPLVRVKQSVYRADPLHYEMWAADARIAIVDDKDGHVVGTIDARPHPPGESPAEAYARGRRDFANEVVAMLLQRAAADQPYCETNAEYHFCRGERQAFEAAADFVAGMLDNRVTHNQERGDG